MTAARKALWLGLAAAVLAGCSVSRGLDPRTAAFPPPRFDPPDPVQEKLPSGAPWFWIEDHDVPLVRLYLAVRAGEVYDPPDKPGLARVASLAWRTGGAGERSPEAFDEALERRGMELGLSLGRDKGWITLSVLPGDLEEGLDLLEALLFEPAFRPDRVEWARTQVAEGIRREADEPQALAFRELRRALYRGHPRGRVPTEESVARISRQDLVRLHQRVIASGDWVLGAVGDFDPDRLRTELQRRFGRLPGSGGGFPRLPPPSEPGPQVVVVPRPLPQATVVWARLGPSRVDPAFAPFEVCDHVLGSGGFGARLVREIRSNRGLAYSVGSFYQALPDFGVLGAYALTKTESASVVVDLLRSEVAGLAASLTESEVREARQSLVNRYVFRYEDPANLVRDRMGLWLEGLPLDLGRRYPEEIRSVTLEQAKRAAEQYLDPSRGVWVVVGDVEPEAPAWSRLGPVRVVEAK